MDQNLWLYHGIANHPDARASLLRRHLARLLDCPPPSITLARDRLGKPYLAAPDRSLWFNMASRDGVVVIAVSDQGPVGVDVETLAHCRDAQNVAARMFSKTEADWLAQRPEAAQALDFAHLWTGKEAVLKALGLGITQGLADPILAPPAEDAITWPPIIAKLRGTPYTVAWYSSTVDEALIITARAQAAAPHGA